MNVFIVVCSLLIVFLLLCICSVLANILVAIYDLTRVTRETPILTRPSSFRRES